MTVKEIERAALRGDELPDGFNGPEQCMYLSFRQLYRDFKNDVINHDQAVREKQRILKAYDNFKQSHDMYVNYTDRWIKAEPMMAAVEKNIVDCPTCNNAQQIIKILDGREK